jgi:hypothetical protein
MHSSKVAAGETATSSKPLAGKRVVLGISGGIAAYKAAELTRLLRQAGATVHVVMTHAAQAFIPPLTLQTLSGNPVATELFDLTQESEIGHITLADSADLLVIAPATADILARLSLGLASDLLTTAPAVSGDERQHVEQTSGAAARGPACRLGSAHRGSGFRRTGLWLDRYRSTGRTD